MKTVLSLIVTALLSSAAAAPTAPADVYVERQTYVMGTLLQVGIAAADRDEAIRAIEEVFGNTRRLEQMLSSWTPDSEIGLINTAPVGKAVEVSDELLRLLAETAIWPEITNGAFDPGVGALTDAWDLRGNGRNPGEAAIADALRSTGLRRFAFDGETGRVRRLDANAWIDTGGFGKGVALRQAETLLRRREVESAHLDFGGQILVFGPSRDGPRWTIAVADPRHREEPAAVLQLKSGSVSTSAQSERFITVDGVRHGHIIDPRNGHPVPSWGSVTVVGLDPVAADIASTALLAMGPAAGLVWAEQQDELGVLFLEEAGGEVRASWNSAFEQYQP